MSNHDLRYVAPELRERTKLAMDEAYLSQRELTITSYKDAVISPGAGVFDSYGKYICGTSVHDGWPWEGGQRPENKMNQHLDVVYLGTFNSCWGHCLTDCLQRLWFKKSPDVSDQVKTLPFVYSVSPPDAQLPQNFFELLSVLEFDLKRMIRVNEPVQFNRVYLPDSCFYRDPRTNLRQFTEEYRTMIKMIANRICPFREIPRRSVYFSRVGWKSKKEIGECRIENEFRRIGYEIIYPERMTLHETVRVLMSCKRFSSTDGSIAHNVVFLPEGTEVAIIRKANYINEYQDCVNSAAGVNVTYIDANRSNMLYNIQRPWYGPFFLYVNKRFADFSQGVSYFPIFDYSYYCIISVLKRVRTWLARTFIGDLKRTLFNKTKI